MEPMHFTTQEFYLYALILNVGLGFLIGLIPLTAGFIKHQRKLAFWGLICSIVGGAILGIFLAIPVAAIFTWRIFKRASASTPESGSEQS